ncbi:hypothetical protein BGZ99_006604 [Dissophora globulifera]|uniref:Uncharacterized protein n=1 Tax=Dissophora globulifera TaxID=979702 RepID=A0A9P6RD35_9FUNG|nr:hypothetical protein BGZ99_006604 [Dissophora globulifera]
MPYFIPPPPQQPYPTRRPLSQCDSRNPDSALDPTLMTPPMSPTDHSFGFAPSSTIDGQFASSWSSSHSHWTDMTAASVQGSLSSPTSSGPFSAPGSTAAASPRPLTFHWDHYEGFDEEDEDSNDEDSDIENTDNDGTEFSTHPREDSSRTGKIPYYRQFEGHHSVARRRSSVATGGSSEKNYDSVRHGIGSSVSDMSEELAKARSKMIRASRAMKSMEQELEAMQLSINESKASNASNRTAIEENFWRLECLALTVEQDRQETTKHLQAIGRDCNEVMEAATNWEVRIDWLGRKVDNTSEYVSELVLSEQECMSFIKMIIQQNQRYAMPAISRATERNIKLMAPPRLKTISHAAHRPDSVAPIQPKHQPQPRLPLQPQPSVRHIPISWLLDPIMPPRPPELSTVQETTHQEASDESFHSSSDRKSTIEPPAEFWRDFSRLTMAFETGQTRTPFSPFQRTRSRSIGPMPAPGIAHASGSGSSSSSSSGGGGSSMSNSSSVFKPAVTRRLPHVENLSPMPKILPPAVAASKLPGIKRRSQNMSHLPVHSWLQFQFNKTMTTPGALTQSGSKKKGSGLGFKPITIFQTTV